ncbi:FimV family protein [Pseudomonas matsuisoli]|uniref:Motility protein FimV n=1 Tax=Pseudomonas matsuisoli TaxID=1515666 RepID=A0A917URS3_9PSED|nr:FimV family protein [Pseudomonas matsuisoli]GGJ80037.1 motility protein FimV [Pseudomonas matsuisoli]
MVQVRKLVLAIAAASSLGSGMAHALGLGELTLQSALNQPLVAEIELIDTRGLDENEVRPTLASPEAFNQAGVDRQYFLTDLKFTPVVRPDGKSVIRVTSTKPVREPYLNFLVEVAWPSGRLMREFTLLLDPPLYAPQTASAAPQLPAAQPRPQAAPAPRAPAPAAPRPALQAAPVVSTPASSGANEYRVGPRETLWEIAERNRSGGSVHQTMLAIQDLNPDAFIDGNINRMKSGQVLRLPNEQQINARSQGEALSQVASQNAAWRQRANVASGERQVDARRRDTAAPTGTQRDTEDNLRLLSGESGEATSGTDDTADGASGRNKALSDKLAVTQESLDTTRRENQELNSRLNDLQSQLEKLQRLMQLKDDQLAKLQAGLAAGQESAANTPAPAAPATPAETAPQAESPVDETSPNGQAAPADPAAAVDSPAPAAPGSEGSEAPFESTPEAGAQHGAEGGNADTDTAAPDVTAQAPAEQPAPEENQAETPAPAEQTAPEDAVSPSASEPAQPIESAEPAAPVAPQEAEEGAESEGLIESLLNNSMLMGIVGGGVLLLLLAALLIARRKREADQENQIVLNDGESDLPPGSFEGLIPAEEAVSAPRDAVENKSETTDALGEADIYIAYGRFNQAAELLLNAIDQEPHRADLRLKLMEVYAELGDREGFARQESELREIGGSAAEIEQLKSRYPGMAQVMAAGVVGGAAATALYAANSGATDEERVVSSTDSLELSDEELDFDFSDLEAELSGEQTPDRSDSDLVLDDFSLDDEPQKPVTETVTEPVFSLEDDLSDFSLDLDDDTKRPVEPPALDEHNEEFLLDDGMNLDRADEDRPVTPAVAEQPESLPSDFDLSLADDEPVQPTQADFAAELERVSAELGELSDELEQSAAAEETSLSDEDALDDEFDFLAGTDEATTKLDLARAYIEMGDNEGAQDILDEVLSEGNDAQQQEARDLMKKLV